MLDKHLVQFFLKSLADKPPFRLVLQASILFDPLSLLIRHIIDNKQTYMCVAIERATSVIYSYFLESDICSVIGHA